MAKQHEETGTSSLDDWIAEVGEEQVATTVKAAIRDIESGATPGFSDKEAFLAYLGRREPV